VIGRNLSYLLHLVENNVSLRDLAAQELELRLRHSSKGGAAITASLHLDAAKDLLRLDAEAIAHLASNGVPTFNASGNVVSVLLEFLGSRDDLPVLGVVPAGQAGDLFVGWANLERVRELAAHVAVAHVETMSAPSSAGGAGARVAAASPGPERGLTGRGVCLAVIDLGFDFLHPGLLDEKDGIEAVRALWLHDMRLARPASAPPGAVGRRFSRLDLENALHWYRTAQPETRSQAVDEHCGRLVDPPGASSEYKAIVQQHGTAVAGIAAGNGRGIGGTRGVAPGVDLALIAIGGHDEQRFADSIEVCVAFQAAFEDVAGPCVALMANSDNLGPHDGSLHGERFLDELLLLPGRAAVVTAGNLNHLENSSKTWHAVAQLGPEGGPPLPLILSYGDGAFFPDSAEVWFRPSPDVPASCTISMRAQDTLTSAPITHTRVIDQIDLPVALLAKEENSKHLTTVDAQLHYDASADSYCLRLFFRPAESEEIIPSTWEITAKAKGPVHAWLDRNNPSFTDIPIARWEGPTARAGAGLTTLGAPAGAARPLAVGSVADDMSGSPSDFSGRGPLRNPEKFVRKPDLVAKGEMIPGPLGEPRKRFEHQRSGKYTTFKEGTSYAAPQVAGACALLFERYGKAATWADIRHAILQATVRKPSMPMPGEGDMWDNACGYGLLCIDTLLAPPDPAGADLWMSKSVKDTGAEPYVAETFWNSPSMQLEDAAGQTLDPGSVATGRAKPSRLRVQVRNRGRGLANSASVRVWWAPAGAVHPLPHPINGGGAWQQSGFGVTGQTGNSLPLPVIASGGTAEVVFDWMAPQGPDGDTIGHVLLAAVDDKEDRYDHAYTVCEQNNATLLSVAAATEDGAAEVTILGSQDTDGLILWRDGTNGRFRVEGLPVTALPWRDAMLFEQAKRSDRPLFGAADEEGDVAIAHSAMLNEARVINVITDITGSDSLELENGRVTIEAAGRLVVPRLRIRPGHRLVVRLRLQQGGGALHVLHLSGGRRVGGCTILAPA
jgi:subtilisin family serine protease